MGTLTVLLIGLAVVLASIFLLVVFSGTTLFQKLSERAGVLNSSFSALQAALTSAAIVAAGWWFLANRQDEPRIRIEHACTERPAAKEKRQTFLGVEVKATNIGNVRVHLKEGKLRLTDVNPGAVVLKEDKVDEVALEPGESDQLYFGKFLLDSSTKTVQVTTELKSPAQGYTWKFHSLCDVGAATTTNSSSVTRGK